MSTHDDEEFDDDIFGDTTGLGFNDDELKPIKGGKKSDDDAIPGESDEEDEFDDELLPEEFEDDFSFGEDE
jgi:hypothetical protein